MRTEETEEYINEYHKKTRKKNQKNDRGNYELDIQTTNQDMSGIYNWIKKS